LWGAFIAPHLPAFERGHFPPANLLPANRTDGCGIGNIPRDSSAQLIRNCYEAGMEAFDAEIARLLSELDSRGELDNTVIIFVGDNGSDQPAVLAPVTIEHAKGTLYQQGVYVPFIVNTPGRSSARRKNNDPVHTADLYRTILDLAGASRSVPSNLSLDSFSLVPKLRLKRKGKKRRGPQRRFNFAQGCVPYTANGWMLNPNFFLSPPHDGQAIADKRYKLINRTLLDDNAEPILDANGQEQRLIEFYDIKRDPYELNNLAEGRIKPNQRRRFRALSRQLTRLTEGKSCSDWRTDVFGT